MTCFALASRRTVLSKDAFVDFDKLDTSESNRLDSDFQRLWSICGELHFAKRAADAAMAKERNVASAKDTKSLHITFPFDITPRARRWFMRYVRDKGIIS